MNVQNIQVISLPENPYFILKSNDSFSVCADPRRKYHVRLLAYNNMEEGYQADQTVSTPGCVCKCCRCMKYLLKSELFQDPSSL